MVVIAILASQHKQLINAIEMHKVRTGGCPTTLNGCPTPTETQLCIGIDADEYRYKTTPLSGGLASYHVVLNPGYSLISYGDKSFFGMAYDNGNIPSVKNVRLELAN